VPYLFACVLTLHQVSWVNSVTPIPDGIESEAAASILCAVCAISIIEYPAISLINILRV
jgi:D-arabinose 1-dehydrogenase-like Zn-dependent alcohol dehydrogenase